jgi:tight adherence protein C
VTELQLVLPGVVIFASIAILTGVAINYALARVSPTRRRVVELATGGRSSGVILSDGPGLTSESSMKKARTIIPKSPKDMGRLQKRLSKAGFHGPRALTIYAIAEVVLPVVGFGGVLLFFGRSGMIMAAALGFIGYMLPNVYLDRRAALRRKEIQNGLADALDLLIVCLEAGLGIDQALLKAGEELSVPYPALGEELRMLNLETRAGKPRIEAFRNLAKRTQVDDVQSLVAMLVQTDKFGTSVAQALRTFAEVSRSKRKQRAEEKAAKLGVKLVFPLVFCLFPAFFVVALGAAIIKLIELFAHSPASGFGGGNF